MRATSASSKPASPSRSAAWSRTPLRAGARVDLHRLDPDDPPRRRARRSRKAHQRHQLLRAQPGHRGRALDRVTGGDLHLCAQRILALDDVAGDVLGQPLDEEHLADHELVDGFFEQLREARHVHALARRVEVDEAVDLGETRRRGRRAASGRPFCTPVTPARARAEPPGRRLACQPCPSSPWSPLHPENVAAQRYDERTPIRRARLGRLPRHPHAAGDRLRLRADARAALEAPAPRYVEMIGAASAQIDELVDQLRLVARIESGRYEPVLVERDSLELAWEAAGRLEEGRVNVAGRGAPVRVDAEPTVRAISQLARAVARFGVTTASTSRSTLPSSASHRSLAPPSRSCSARRRGSSRHPRPRFSSARSEASSRRTRRPW